MQSSQPSQPAVLFAVHHSAAPYFVSILCLRLPHPTRTRCAAVFIPRADAAGGR